MKKIVLLLLVAAGLLSCAKEMMLQEKTSTAAPMKFEINVAGTKAAKADWADGDVIYVFFKDLNPNYLIMTYTDGAWNYDFSYGPMTDIDFVGVSEQTLTAVHFPVPVDVDINDEQYVFLANGELVFNYYLFDAGKNYDVDGDTVSATLEMGKPNDFVQFHVAGIKDKVEDYFFSCSKVMPVACTGVLLDGSIITRSRPVGDFLRGVADEDGAVFGGVLLTPDSEEDYEFVLTSPDKISALRRTRTLSAGARYNFPEPSDEQWEYVLDLSRYHYDFLHKDGFVSSTVSSEDHIPFGDFIGNDGTVKFWTQVEPFYFTGVYDDGQKVDFRHALLEYDVQPLNLLDVFEIVDDHDRAVSPIMINRLNLSVEFSTYDEPAHSGMWMDNTTFYYDSKEAFIPIYGKLFVTVGDQKYQLPTRFSRPKASSKNPEIELDYSSFAVVPWRPLKDPTMDYDYLNEKILGPGVEIENALTYAFLVRINDNRPNDVSYHVMTDGGWIYGNVEEFDPDAGTYTTGGNGYILDALSRDAYHISVLAEVDIPEAYRKYFTLYYLGDDNSTWDEQDDEGTREPFLRFDYPEGAHINENFDVNVTLTFETPWQKLPSVEGVIHFFMTD